MTKLKNRSNEECEQKAPVCAVIGMPVEHSLSPSIHQHFASQCNLDLIYIKIRGKEESIKKQIENFFDDGGLGLNVTLPFKGKAYQMAEILTTRAIKAKAANTLWLNTSGQLCADNTDGLGLLFSLNLHTDLQHKKVLLLGAGGAAKGVIQSLLDSNIGSLTVANRSFDKLLSLKQQFNEIEISAFENLEPCYDVIINATSSSIDNKIPDVNSKIISGCLCVDMFYDRKRDTSFVIYCKNNGAIKSIDGLEMLVGQAAASFEIWHKLEINAQQTLRYI